MESNKNFMNWNCINGHAETAGATDTQGGDKTTTDADLSDWDAYPALTDADIKELDECTEAFTAAMRAKPMGSSRMKSQSSTSKPKKVRRVRQKRYQTKVKNALLSTEKSSTKNEVPAGTSSFRLAPAKFTVPDRPFYKPVGVSGTSFMGTSFMGAKSIPDLFNTNQNKAFDYLIPHKPDLIGDTDRNI